MYRREITERERERFVERETETKKHARVKNANRVASARSSSSSQRERERKEIYRTITPQWTFFSRVKNKNNSIAGAQHAPSYRCPARQPR